MLIDRADLEKAKEKLGVNNAYIIAELLELDNFDEKNLKACCPYHDERTASFIYNKKAHNFKCFGCGRTVDLIDVLMEKGNTFLQAAEYLFDKAGMEYSFGERDVRTKHNYKYPHEEPINDKPHVIEYLGRRGISKNVIDYLDIREDKNGNCVLNFYDTNDVLTMVKYRPSHSVDKSSGMAKTWCQKDADTSPLLFNMNRVNTTKPLLICEGEVDCASVIEAGYTNTVSVPLGAGNLHWIEENWDWLNTFDSIIIWADNDEPGIKMRKECIYRLGTWRTKYIVTPDYYEKEDGRRIPTKDANDCLQVGGKEYVMNLISEAKDVPVTSVVDYSDLEELDISKMDGVKTGIKPLDNELDKLYYGTLTILSGRPGCVDSETEYFNGTGWKKISEYRPGDKVLQYNADGTANLVEPIQYHKYPCDSFWKLKSAHGINQMLSDEHNLVYLSSKGNLVKKNILDFIDSHNKTKFGSEAKFITNFSYGGDGIALSEEQIRVMCMVIADGYFPSKNINNLTCHVRIKKARKKERAARLLDGANIPYEIHHWDKKHPEYVTYVFNAPLKKKVFDEYFYRCDNRQLNVIADECLNWDGTRSDGRESYSTTIKQTADFIQFAFSASGYRSHVGVTQERIGRDGKVRKREYTISKTKAKYVSLRSNSGTKIKIDRISASDGYKYCFTVPSGMLILRRDGDINITGNSGKTSLIDQAIARTIDGGDPVFLFSKELPERLSANWFNTIIAGRRNMVEKQSMDGKKYYVVPYSTQKTMQNFYSKKLFIYKDDEPNDYESVLKSAEECVRKFGCKLIVLDNLMMLDLKCNESEKNTAQTNLINLLIKFAVKFNVAVVLIAHPRKTQDSNSDIEMYDIAGSSNIINLAMRSIGLRRVSKKEKEDDKCKWKNYDVVLTVMKDRMFGKSDVQIGLWYDLVSRRFYTDYAEYDAQFAWDQKYYPDKLPYENRAAVDVFPDR